MGLLKKFLAEFDKVIGLCHNVKYPVYCQYCGKNITNEIGATLSTTGKIYCKSPIKNSTLVSCDCLIPAVMSHLNDGVERIEYGTLQSFISMKNIQKGIRKRELVNYGPKK